MHFWHILILLFSLISSHAAAAQSTRLTAQAIELSEMTGEPIPPVPIKPAYAEAYRAHIDGRDYAATEQFALFELSNADVAAKAEARYWQGVNYARQNKPATAARIFYQSLTYDPKGKYASFAAFSLGSMLHSVNKKKEACLAWDELEDVFTAPEFTNIRLVGAERRTRFDCPNKNTTASARNSAVATQPPASGNKSVAASTTDLAVLAVEVSGNNEVETYISKNQCTIEIRVNTPEEWLDDARMKRLVVANGIQLISQRACRDKFGREPEDISVVVRQKLDVPGFRFGTTCPDEITSVRPWMCDYLLAGNYLGAVGSGDSRGAGVTAQVERKVVTDAQFKSWGDNAYWMMFGNRPYEKIADDLYLVSYTNSALGKKLSYDQKISREKNEQSARLARKQKEDAAEAKRLSQMAAFRRSSIASLPASQKGYGTLAVNKAAEDCFRVRMGPVECKGFLISVVKPLALSRADQANGITAIIQVKITALRRGLPNGAWSGTCQTTTFIQSASGGWVESRTFVIRDYALNCNF